MTYLAMVPVIWVVCVLFLVGLIVCATVVIRRDDRTVKNPRAMTAMYEKKIEDQDTDRIRKDWESYYDRDRGNTDEEHPRTDR